MQHEQEVLKAALTELDWEGGPANPESDVRSKTSMRMHYEAQTEVIRKQIGNLEEIRMNLGLSQRKISQLLLIDPSSWTRWVKKGDSVPPHIWRALQWYMTLQEKIPGLTPQYFLGKDPQVLHQKALSKIHEESLERKALEARLQDEILHLKRKNQTYRRFLIFTLGILAFALGSVFILAARMA